MACETSVEHWSVGRGAAPGCRVAHIAPGIETPALDNPAHGVGDGRPTAEMVFVDVVDGLPVTQFRNHGEHTVRTRQIGVSLKHQGFVNDLTSTDVCLNDGVTCQCVGYGHLGSLVVVAVGECDYLGALRQSLHLVERRVIDILRLETRYVGISGACHGMRLRGAERRVIENVVAVFLHVRHAPVAVIRQPASHCAYFAVE